MTFYNPRSTVLLIIIGAVTACGVPELDRVQIASQAIVGGIEYDPSNFPAVGFLRSRKNSTDPWEQFCTGTLVGKFTVITAGHCLLQADTLGQGNLEFALGPDENTVTLSAEVVAVVGPTNITNSPDIAMVHLATDLGVTPMKLRTTSLSDTLTSFAWLGETVRLIGYGATEKSGDTFVGRGVRRTVEVEVIDPAQLDPVVSLPNTIPFLVFHNDPNNSKASCFGDSGGPAIHLNPVTGEHEVVGVSSGANSQDCIYREGQEIDGATFWYQRTDVQHDLLMCDASTCSNHGLCFLPDVCSCDVGYQGDDCSQVVEVDACADSPCFSGVTCTNALAPDTGFTCGPCPAGYSGDGETCTDVDECAENLADCHKDAGCANTEGSFSCTCSEGFTGNGQSCQPKGSEPTEPIEHLEPGPSDSGSCQLTAGASPEGFSLPLLLLALLWTRRRQEGGR